MSENLQDNTAIRFLDTASNFIKDTRSKINNVMTKAKENGLTLPKVRQIDSAEEAISGIGKIIGSGNRLIPKIWGGIINKAGGEIGKVKEEIKKVNEEMNGNNIEQDKEDIGNIIEQSTENKNTNNEIPSIKDIWAREDEIRKETQAREDTAYQRAVEDMKKAGINPNLVGINPAASGGGIIQASGQSTINTELNNIVEETLNKINNEVKMNEGQKDRTSDILRTLVMALLIRR